MSAREPELSIETLLEHHGVEPKALHRRAARLTRRKILLAAMECFAHKGYQKTTIREISAKAGVTLGALYHHFKGKKELLMQMNRSRQINSLDITRTALEEHEDFFTGLRKALRDQFHLLAEDPVLRGVFREYMGLAMTDPVVNRMHSRNDMEFHDLFLKGLAGSYPDVPSEVITSHARMILVSFQGLITNLAVHSPIGSHYKEILDGLLDLFRSSIEGQQTGISPDTT
jgi:AcrR family transcriptional regulator